MSTSLSQTTFPFAVTPEQRLEDDFRLLPPGVQCEVDFRLECLAWVANQGKGKVTASLHKIVAKHSGCFNTWHTRWTRYTKGTLDRETYQQTIPPGDWRNVLDKRYQSKFWKRKKRVGLPHEFIEDWKRRCAATKAGSAAAYRNLLLDLAEWRAGDHSKKIDGYFVAPANAPGHDHPAGWSYDNLMDPKRNHLTPVEVAAARDGREAAKKFVPGFISTRAHSWPLQRVEFDDFWMKFEVIHPMSKTPVRLLNFHAVDNFTGYLFQPATKPRLRNISEDKMDQLNEREFRLYALHFLRTVGWSRRGTILQNEKGTASFRITSKRGAAFYERLKRWCPGLTIEEPGMSGKPAHTGAYREREKGNPNRKPLVELSHRIYREQLGYLGGQVGPNNLRVPADLTGREKEAETLLSLEEQVPALAGELSLGIARFDEALQAIERARQIINADPHHQMEGWAEAGLIAEEVVVDPTTNFTIDLAEAKTWEPVRYQMLQLQLAQNPDLVKTRQLTRAEALAKRLPDSDRLYLPREAMWELLGPDFAQVRPIVGGQFVFQSQDLGPGKHRYLGQYQDSAGFTKTLAEGTDYLTFVDPFEPEVLHVGDARTGAFLGYCPIRRAADRTDTDAINAEVGKAEARLQDAVRDLAKREGLKRVPGIDLNTRKIEQTSQPNRRLEEAITEAGHRPEEFGLNPDTLLDDPTDRAEDLRKTDFPRPPATPPPAFNPANMLDDD